MNKSELVKNRKNKCCKCGLIANENNLKNFHFHHLSSKTKVNNISNMYHSKELTKELKKTRLLCATCHRELHKKYGKVVTKQQSLEFINN